MLAWQPSIEVQVWQHHLAPAPSFMNLHHCSVIDPQSVSHATWPSQVCCRPTDRQTEPAMQLLLLLLLLLLLSDKGGCQRKFNKGEKADKREGGREELSLLRASNSFKGNLATGERRRRGRHNGSFRRRQSAMTHFSCTQYRLDDSRAIEQNVPNLGCGVTCVHYSIVVSSALPRRMKQAWKNRKHCLMAELCSI